jgi:uncharacterized Zn finger protein (UPF0148 family)
MAIIIMTTRCPHCKCSIELDKDGMATCCGCGYDININRYN